ncbi:class I SAM-dependent methyltransferase [Brevundimonas sp.]|uniref:class I SAM-dependent methyltransferase n=1 Tax=Brevundimonas sp. TaxID=1871086 RepID=UPI003D127DED
MDSSELTADDIREGYQRVLGRSVESDTVIEQQRGAHRTRESFWAALLASDEFNGKSGGIMGQLRRTLMEDFSSIHHTVTPDQLRILMERIREQWTALGETEPHWSVLTSDEFRADKLDEVALAEFNRSGHDMAVLVDIYERRSGASAGRGVCLELGCGVGRITAHLAKRFERVIAVDISPGNLRLCDEYMKAQGIDNVETRLVSDPTDFENFPPIDFFYSVLVLQHNSPPVQKFTLNAILKRIRPGGAAFFQIPTSMAGYRFDIDEYLTTSHPVMELHSLPPAVVLKLISDNGLVLRDISPDPMIGIFGSNTFFATKP